MEGSQMCPALCQTRRRNAKDCRPAEPIRYAIYDTRMTQSGLTVWIPFDKNDGHATASVHTD